MKHLNDLEVPGTETHAQPAHTISETPSPEFLQDIAELLETEPDDLLAEPDYVGLEGAHGRYSRPERGSDT